MSGINHIWTVRNIIFWILKSNANPIIIQKFDFSQFFDSMELGEAIYDISDSIDDNRLNILYDAIKEVRIKVKTSFGLSDEYLLKERVLQGDTWGPVFASKQVDKFGKEMLDESSSFMFWYKSIVPIPLLAQCNYILGISKVGFKSVQLSSFLNVKAVDKHSQFGASQCKSMIFSRKAPADFLIPKLKVYSWSKEIDENNIIKKNRREIAY